MNQTNLSDYNVVNVDKAIWYCCCCCCLWWSCSEDDVDQ